MEVTYLPQIATLNDLVEELHKVFESDSVNVEYVHSVMASYKSNPIEWKNFAKFDRYRYTRNLINEGNGKFNLMLLCWGPSHTSTIHDHADAHCFMKMLSGSLQEVRFEWPKTEEGEEEHEMVEMDRNVLKLNDVCYINDSLGLHRVENASHSEGAVSLHLYCPPFSSCSVFDERSGKKMKCPVTFWSKFGKKMEVKKAKCDC
ncbi:cysteine dioxygenase type 1-like [Homarus americanus]|uniref:Cysteine dioxygenase n=1 Tax=Homarus americanus TaxID=6706 RepID=A0A8J5JI76_HOMAM|nr:cysteine dioxygenase type 1-like [Homarus americanus]KAG7156626.1 Cysteine dioxygenase type 1-like [Homarus americanus]